MTDFRALCAELIDDLELADWPSKLKESFRADIQRARAALAEPEPEVAGELTDQELLRCANIGTPCYDLKGWERELRMMRAAIAADRACWGHQPAPPADGEVAECAALADGPAVPDGREPASVDTSLALRVQQLEAMRETEKAALLDAFQQIDRLKIDRLKALIDWQYTKIHRLELAIAAELEGAQ